MKKDIPMELATVCAHFVDIVLKWLFSIDGLQDLIIIENHDIHKTETLNLIKNSKWDNLTPFDKRLLMDILLLNNDHFITEIECLSSTFGIEGAKWISIFLSNTSHPVQYINLSDCNLNRESVEIVAQSLQQNQLIENTIWLDLSNNKEIDDISTKILISTLPKLYCLRLNNCSITNKSLEYFQNFEKEYKDGHHILINLKNNSIDDSKWKDCHLKDEIFVISPKNKVDGHEWRGVWQSVYGGDHGLEYQYVDNALNKDGSKYLIARKITGDVNVPQGKITWKLNEIPVLQKEAGSVDERIRGNIQVRYDINNPNGFEWDDITLVSVTENHIHFVWHIYYYDDDTIEDYHCFYNRYQADKSK